MLDDPTGIRQRDGRRGEQGKRKVGRAGQAPWTLSVPTWSPLLQPSAPPHRALSSHGPAPQTRSTSCLALQVVPLCHPPPNPQPPPPAIKSQQAALIVLGPQPVGDDGGTVGKTCPYSTPREGWHGKTGGRKMGENRSELTQRSTRSGEVPGRHLLHVVKRMGWGGSGNECWGQVPRPEWPVQLSENHLTQVASPFYMQIRRKEEREENRERSEEGQKEGRDRYRQPKSITWACGRPAAILIISTVAAATKQYRLPHLHPGTLTIISPKILFMAEKTGTT